MCKFFDLSPEGEDPREYDEDKEEVVGIANLAPPVWKERTPWLPGNWTRRLNIADRDNTNITIQIIDVAWYHDDIEGLKEVIERFSPTILVVDWCHNGDGYTARQLKKAPLSVKLFWKTKNTF